MVDLADDTAYELLELVCGQGHRTRALTTLASIACLVALLPLGLVSVLRAGGSVGGSIDTSPVLVITIVVLGVTVVIAVAVVTTSVRSFVITLWGALCVGDSELIGMLIDRRDAVT